jgi:choice-of-anchor A domain-containing protein
MVGLLLLTGSSAQAGFVLGSASNFAVLFEGNQSKTLNFNNSNITGNIGIGNTGKFADAGGCSGKCLISGLVEFSAANTGQFTSSSGTTYTPALSAGTNPLYSQSTVTDALNTVNTLSQSLASESGTAVTIQNGGSLSASSGTLDSSGNRVFTATMNPFDAGQTFTINGSASDYVVINVSNTGGHGFNGSVVLQGGITSDHVLFNLDKGNYSTLSGGDTLTISTNGATTSGIFLDPNGNIQINHSTLDGRLFGGDSQDMQIVSGANIVAPLAPVPEPRYTLLSGALLGMIGYLRLRRSPTRV